MKGPRRIMDVLLELNIAALIFLFPFIHIRTGRLFNTVWSALLILWVLSLIIRKGRMQFPASAPLLIVFSGVVAAASLLSADTGMRLKGLSYMLQGTALFLAAYDFYRQDEERMKRTLAYILVSTSLVAVDGVIQAFLGRDVLGIPPVLSRATAFFIHPFYLALWSGIGLLIGLSWFMRAPGRTGRALAGTCVLLLAAAFLFSRTRAAWIAMAFLILLVFFSSSDRSRLIKLLIPAFSLPLVLVLADQSFRARFFSIFAATDPRTAIWTQSWTMITDRFSPGNWILGRGPGLFKADYPPYDLIGGGETFPHLIGLELLYAAGIAGIIAFVAWFVHYILTVRPAKNLLQDNSHRIFINAIPVLVLAVCFINESFFSRYFSFLFWFTAGFAAAYAERSRVQSAAKEVRP